LPIFGLFMEKVYRDKSLGIRVGFFPKKKYPLAYCPTRIPKKDTSSAAPVEPGPPEPEELELE